MKNNHAWMSAAFLALSLAGAAHAADAPGIPNSATPQATITSETELTAGEVRKIDAGLGKLTIEHEAISNLDMPGMTMVFRAAKPGMLDGLKLGDRIRFRAESISGALTLTRIEMAP